MKKKLFIIISVAIILIYLFYPDTIVSKIDLEKLSQTGNLKLEFIHKSVARKPPLLVWVEELSLGFR